MEDIMAVLTDEQESFVGTISIRGMSTHRARLTGVMGIDLDCQRLMQERLIGNHALQLCKRPFGIGRLSFPLLAGRFLALLAFRSLTDVCQVLQPNQAVWVLCHDAFGDDMIGVLLQPSLPSTDDDESSRCGTGAFLLQTFSQSRVMVGFGNNGFARMESTLPLGGRGHRQVTHTDINPNDAPLCLWGWLCYLNFQGDEQVELLVGLVVPQLGSTKLGTMRDLGNMCIITRVGDNHTPGVRQDARLLLTV